MNLLLRRPANETKCRDLGDVSQAGKLLQYPLAFDGQAVQFPNHEVHDIIRVPLDVNAIEVPAPPRLVIVESKQPFFGERRNELNGEKWIASSLVMDQFRQRSDALRFAAQ